MHQVRTSPAAGLFSGCACRGHLWGGVSAGVALPTGPAEWRWQQTAGCMVTESLDHAWQVEANVKLEESLKKTQQENEDYRVRMDKHAALSR